MVNNTFVPKGIGIVDIEASVVSNLKENLKLTDLEGNLIRIETLLSLEKFYQYEQRMSLGVKTPDGDLPMPFMVLIREDEDIRGKRFGDGFSAIPTDIQFPTYRVTETVNGKLIHKIYTIPQPVHIDLSYNLSFISDKRKDINKMQERIVEMFRSVQHYIEVNGHYMPMTLSSLSDDSETEIEKQNYYKKMYSLTVQGYLLDESKFKVVTVDNDVAISFNMIDTFTDDNDVIRMKFKRSPVSSIVYNGAQRVISRSNLQEIETIKLNEAIVEFPFSIQKGDNLEITQTKTDSRVFSINLF